MNKKLVLFVLPALMALSSCSAIGHTDAQPKGNFFKEEAGACVELFGGNEDAIEFKRMTPLRSAAGDMVEPRVGVQYRAKYNIGTELSPDWRVAVRFVAEIKTLNVNVTWTRSVYQANGTRLGTETSTSTTKAYTSLNSNSTDITPSDGYNYFVAYTLSDIPFASFDNHYIVAYVTLSDTTEPAAISPVRSKAMAAQIGGEQQFAFDIDRTGYFLTDCESKFVDEDDPTRNTNLASFTVNLEEDESFLIVKNDRTNSKFQVWDSSCLDYAENDDVISSFTNNDGLIKAIEGGKFALYLNSEEHLYRSKYTQTADYYVVGPAGPNLGGDGWTFPATTSPYRFFECPSEDHNLGELLNVHLNEGNFKVASTGWSGYELAYWGFKHIGWNGYDQHGSSSTVTGGAASHFEASGEGRGANIHCKDAGYYNLYITDDDWLSIELVSLD